MRLHAPAAHRTRLSDALVQSVLDIAARMMSLHPPTRATRSDCGLEAVASFPGAVMASAMPHASEADSAGPRREGVRPAAGDASGLSAHGLHYADAQEVDSRMRLAEQLHACSPSPASWLNTVLSAIVTASSQRQALAGLLATGPVRSLWYVGLKLQKRLQSLRS